MVVVGSAEEKVAVILNKNPAASAPISRPVTQTNRSMVPKLGRTARDRGRISLLTVAHRS